MSDTIKLPPLPRTHPGNEPLFNEEQVEEFARAAVQLNMPKVPKDAELDNLVAWFTREANAMGVPADYEFYTKYLQAANAITALRQELVHWQTRADAYRDERDALRKDAEYYKWRLKAIIPLFEEARDALTAIPMTIAKMRNIDLSLGDRMDKAGTATRADFEAIDAAKGKV